jgi:uncharacterized membrane protein YeiH
MYALIGFTDLANRDLMVISFLMLLASIVLAWIIDLVAERVSYGVFGNFFVALLSIYGGLALHQRYLGQTLQADPVRLIGIILATVVVAFFLLALIRRLKR